MNSRAGISPTTTEATISSARVKKLASPVAMATPVLKIATFHSSSLGSLVASLGALVALRDSFPGARICSFARAPLLPLLRSFSAVDEANARPGGGISSQAALMARLHGGDFDLALSFSQGSNALLLMWATGAPIRAGFVPSRMDALLTHKIAKEGPLRPVCALELVRGVGASPRGENARDWLPIPFSTTQQAEKILQEGGIEGQFLVVSTEIRKSEIAKTGVSVREVDAEMLRELSARFPVVLVGLKRAKIALLAPGETPHPILDLGGQTDVLTLAALCQTARGVFGVGSGVLQLGHFFEKPTVSTSESDFPARRALQLFGF
ncbi:MAG TPA: hypothetical protein VGB45_08120 [Abditibacterium sp.]|jgi:ADP-heptose:LPS heptosyltransferase